jgi:tripartite-type tricarboxylate transporter receptor subunit TctC
MRTRWVISFPLIGLLSFSLGSRSVAQEQYFKNKTLTFIVGAAPGGGFDTYTRLIGRHLPKHIDGNPTVVVQNMTGAGSLIAANHIYSRAKPDGLTVGVWVGSLALQKYLGSTTITFDPMKFEWIGVPVQQTFVCALTKTSGISTMDQWFRAKRPVKLGGQAPGTRLDDIPMLLHVSLGLPVQLIQGYKGTAEVVLAAQAGEVDGVCTSWQGIKSSWKRQIATGDATVVVQTNRKPIAELSEVPLAINFAKTEDAKRLINVGIHDVNAVTLAYSAPPNTPKHLVEVLRKAFGDTLRDPELMADAKKADLDIDPMTGEELEKTIAGFGKLPPPIATQLKDILLPKK